MTLCNCVLCAAFICFLRLLITSGCKSNCPAPDNSDTMNLRNAENFNTIRKTLDNVSSQTTRLPTLSFIALQDSRQQTFRLKNSMQTLIFQPFTPENLQRFSSVNLLYKRHTSGTFSIRPFLHVFAQLSEYDATENNGRNNWVFRWS